MKISIVVPVYNKQNVIYQTLANIYKVLGLITPSFEIIAVYDGCSDNSVEIGKSFDASEVTHIVLSQNKGKSHAVRMGMEVAKGELIGYLDAGLEIDTLVILDAFTVMLTSPDIQAISATTLGQKSIYKAPWQRKVFKSGFITLTSLLFNLDVRETQVGFKLFRRDAIQRILPNLRDDNWLFDLEAFAVMKKLGFNNTKEIPALINMHYNLDESRSARPVQILKIFRDLLILSLRVGRFAKFSPIRTNLANKND